MAVNFFRAGLDLLGGDPNTWENDAYMGLLLKGSGYSFDASDVFVDDLVPGSNEVTAAGYARDTVTSPSRTVNVSPSGIYYDAVDLNFGSLAAGQGVTSMVIFKDEGSDAANLLVAQFTFASVDSGALSPFAPTFNPSGAFYLSAA